MALKHLFIYTALLLSAISTNAQYYLRGEIKDENNQPLQNVKIFLHSNHNQYFSGLSGGFGINTSVPFDSLTLSLDGYENKTVRVNSQQWQTLSIRILPSTVKRNRLKLISVTRDRERGTRFRSYFSDETYFQLVENEMVDAKTFPVTGLSLNVNKASYSNVRRFLNMNSTVPPDAVRTEELLNYFNLHYQEPENGDLFRIESQLTSCPWDPQKQLLLLNVNAKKTALDKVPPGNFVFLLDASGSMEMPNRLPLLKAAFQLFVRNLRPVDTVSIVCYGGTVAIWLQPTSGVEKEKILQSIEKIEADGDTPGGAAIITAYRLAQNSFIKGGNNRVILATDGDFNVGASSEQALDELITREKQSGIFLTCLGVGTGNFKDSKLETLAKKGNGNYAYLDDINEAEKVLVKELTQNFYAVAEDVFMNVRFDPEKVKGYRLIGFDNRKDAIANNTIEMEGGEVGSGNSVMAVFEILPDSASGRLNGTVGNIARLDIKYSCCNDSTHHRISYDCPASPTNFKDIDRQLQFAVSLTMFGMKLKQSKYIKEVNWDDIEALAAASYDPGVYLQTEYIQLIEKAKKIYNDKKKKKKEKD